LDLAFGVGRGEDVPCFEVVVFGSPQNVGDGGFGFIADGVGQGFLFYVEDLDCAVLATLL
jgi:hypothetical protein